MEHFIEILRGKSWRKDVDGAYLFREYKISILSDGWSLTFDGERIAEGTYAAKAYAVVEEELAKRGHLQRD